MRPRISRAEASYLCEVLTAQREQLHQRYLDLKELERCMDRIIFDLKHRVQAICIGTNDNPHYYLGKRIATDYRIVGDREALNIFHIYKELKAEHPRIQAEAFNVYLRVQTHEKLLAKYGAIASGVSKRGTYKHLSLAHTHFP
jgi:hypothetical protein